MAARSQELATCGNSLWGCIRDIPPKQCYQYHDELKAAAITVFETITLLCWEKCFTDKKHPKLGKLKARF